MGITFREFAESKPNLKFIFTGGKGGVGKTIAAAGIAYHYASRGNRTLVVSLNPVHSLSSVFGQDLWGGGIKRVQGIDNLWACEIDITDKIEEYKQDISQRVRQFLKYADIPIKVGPFIEIATTNPAFEESAMFDEMLDIMLKEAKSYDKICFDCAAVANAVRLLGLHKIYDLWLKRMAASRQEALSLRVKLSFRKDKIREEVRKDPLMAGLMDMRGRVEQAKGLLGDDEKTAFFFVTLPLALPIAVVKRFIRMVQAFDIPVGGVFVNMVIPEEVVKRETVTTYLRNKYEEQEGYLEVIEQELGDLIRAHIPLFETEVTGIDMIKRVANAIVSPQPFV